MPATIKVTSRDLDGKRIYLRYGLVEDRDVVVGVVVAASKPKEHDGCWYEPVSDQQLSGIFASGEEVELTFDDLGRRTQGA